MVLAKHHTWDIVKKIVFNNSWHTLLGWINYLKGLIDSSDNHDLSKYIYRYIFILDLQTAEAEAS